MPLSFPYQDSKPTQINRHQAAESTVRITADGLFRVDSRFTNAKQLDGDHFVTIVTAYSGEKPVAIIKQIKGLNARGWGGTVEQRDSTQGTIPSNALAQIDRVTIEHGLYDWVDDSLVWKVIGETVKEFLRNKDSGFQMVS
ncbi:MAG TPA: hypothetical protein VGN97_02745 [Mesorhizobium sp.]|nr:hypothetical protein [Mesorhizobium sp.]